MTKRPWTPEECRQAALLREGGATLDEIAAALGRGRDSVAIKLTRMTRGRPKPKRPHHQPGEYCKPLPDIAPLPETVRPRHCMACRKVITPDSPFIFRCPACRSMSAGMAA